MKKTVLFLGAGMSATFGYPLTKDILPRMIQKIKTGTLLNEVTKDREISALYRKLLKQLIISLSPGISFLFNPEFNVNKFEDNLPLVTELLSQLEHLINSNHNIVDWNFEIKDDLLKPQKINDRWDLNNLKTLFDWAIISIIDHKKEKYSKKISEFLRWVTRKNQGRARFISIISTNYDVAVEWELLNKNQTWNANAAIDFGCSWRDPINDDKSIVYNRPSSPTYRIFKLHGSVDWLKCDRCGFIYINPTQPIYTLTYSNKKSVWNMCHCGYWPLRPLLVTPSFVRKVNDTSLAEIWRNSFEELRTADRWIIVGYSLPPEDFDIRSLFLRAMMSNEKDIKVKVIQLGRTTEDRYDFFFGKNNFEFFENGFEAYIDTIMGLSKAKSKKKEPVIKAKYANV